MLPDARLLGWAGVGHLLFVNCAPEQRMTKMIQDREKEQATGGVMSPNQAAAPEAPQAFHTDRDPGF